MKMWAKFSLVVLAVLSVLVSNLYAESYIKVWERTYGGKENDSALAITPTKDGCFIVAGWTESFGDNSDGDVYLIKIDRYRDKV